MKKSTFSVILAMIMVFTMLVSASAAEATASYGTAETLEVKSISSFPLISDAFTKVSQLSDCGDDIMPLDNLHPLTPLGLYVYPIIIIDGEQYAVTDERAVFYSAPLDFQNFIRTTYSSEKQNEVKNLLSDAGLEQIGWLLETGYNLNVYNPIRWQYYWWAATGKSSLIVETAKNENKIFQIFSYFEDETSSSYKFGITGDVVYRTSATSATATIPIELSVTFAN